MVVVGSRPTVSSNLPDWVHSELDGNDDKIYTVLATDYDLEYVTAAV